MGKLPPQAPELEESVLGALMIEKDAYASIADLLRPESFYVDSNACIFEAIRALAAKDAPIDMLSVVEQLKAQGNLEKAGGVVRLSELTRRVASAAHLRYHAQIVAQKATARDLISVACQIEEKGYDETQDVDVLLHEAEGGIFESYTAADLEGQDVAQQRLVAVVINQCPLLRLGGCAEQFDLLVELKAIGFLGELPAGIASATHTRLAVGVEICAILADDVYSAGDLILLRFDLGIACSVDDNEREIGDLV